MKEHDKVDPSAAAKYEEHAKEFLDKIPELPLSYGRERVPSPSAEHNPLNDMPTIEQVRSRTTVENEQLRAENARLQKLADDRWSVIRHIEAEIATLRAERDNARQHADERWTEIVRMRRKLIAIQEIVRAHHPGGLPPSKAKEVLDLAFVEGEKDGGGWASVDRTVGVPLVFAAITAEQPCAHGDTIAGEALTDAAWRYALGQLPVGKAPCDERAFLDAAHQLATQGPTTRPIQIEPVNANADLWRAKAVQLAVALEEACGIAGDAHYSAHEEPHDRLTQLRALLEGDLAEPLAKLKRLREAVEAAEVAAERGGQGDRAAALQVLLIAAREVVR
jgi:hypothetical protein